MRLLKQHRAIPEAVTPLPNDPWSQLALPRPTASVSAVFGIRPLLTSTPPSSAANCNSPALIAAVTPFIF